MARRDLEPTGQDFQQLWMLNPLANEQLQKIILQRLLQECETRNINKTPSNEPRNMESDEPEVPSGLVPQVENSPSTESELTWESFFHILSAGPAGVFKKLGRLFRR